MGRCLFTCPRQAISLTMPDLLLPYLALRERPVDQPVVMYQRWRSLLFLHWAFNADLIQATLPAGLTVDTFAGEAFVGVVPFFMRAIRPRFLPAVPGISNFLETNVRTYVRDRSGRPGVWFYSLDANRRLAVAVARLTFHLPYFFARMSATTMDLAAGIDYRVQRGGTGPGESRFIYRARTDARRSAEPGSFDFFLVERYLLLAEIRPGRLAGGRVHHTPYPLAPVEIIRWDDQLLQLAGFPDPGRPPDHVTASPGVDVEVFPLRRL